MNFSAVHRSTSAVHWVTIAQSTSWTSSEATTQTHRASNSTSSLTARSLTSSSSTSETKSAPSIRFSISVCTSPRSCEPRLRAGKATYSLSFRHLRSLADISTNWMLKNATMALISASLPGRRPFLKVAYLRSKSPSHAS